MKTQLAIVVICALLGIFYGCTPIGPGFSLGLGYGAGVGVLLALIYETIGGKK